MVSVLLSLSFFLEFPMASTSSGRPSATGAPSVNVVTDFTYVGRRVDCPDTKPLGNKASRMRASFSKEDVVTVELQSTPLVLVVHLVEGE